MVVSLMAEKWHVDAILEILPNVLIIPTVAMYRSHSVTNFYVPVDSIAYVFILGCISATTQIQECEMLTATALPSALWAELSI